MAAVTPIRNALKDSLEAIVGLTGYARPGGTINLPAAIVLAGPIVFDETMGRGADTLTFEIVLLVAESTPELAQEQLDPYMDGDGETSVKGVVESEDTLGGLVDWVRVTGVNDYGDIEYSGKRYLGARFPVEVSASGT